MSKFLSDAIKDELKLIRKDVVAKSNGTYKDPGLPSGIGISRLVPGGIPFGVLSVLCGDTGVGKSQTVDNISDAVSSVGEYVLRFSPEDSVTLNAQRAISRSSGVPFGDILTRSLRPGDEGRIANFSDKAKACIENVIFDDTPGVGIDYIIKRDEELRKKYPIKLTVIDYVQILSDVLDEEKKGFRRVMLKLQERARLTNTAWLVVSQFNRDATKNREDPRPRRHDLYGSSVLEQTAKLIIGMHRPCKYGDPIKGRHYEEGQYPSREAWYNRLEAWVIKNVRGPDDQYINLQIDWKTGRMRVE